jgi:CDP-6-deoxy-D-xylo-4-hexulose-3-dehydrase
MVNSGSSANLVAIAALFFKSDSPLRPGDEVLVPGISWSTTYFPLQQYGLKLKFIDVDLETLNIDMKQVREAWTPKTRLVVAVNILGNPCQLDELKELAAEKGAYFFEDNCESMGATVAGKSCGTFGDIGTFSTFYSHHISTMEGGVCLTNSRELWELMICLRAHGWTRNLPQDSTLYEKRSDDFFEAYRFILPGYNVRPIEMSAAIGREQLKKLDRMIEIRRANARHFQELFHESPTWLIQRETGKSSWFSFTLMPKPGTMLNRSKILAALKSHGIEHRIITGGCFLRHDVIRYFNYESFGDLKNANYAHDHGFFVGNFPVDSRPNLDRLFSVLKHVS